MMFAMALWTHQTHPCPSRQHATLCFKVQCVFWFMDMSSQMFPIIKHVWCGLSVKQQFVSPFLILRMKVVCTMTLALKQLWCAKNVAFAFIIFSFLIIWQIPSLQEMHLHIVVLTIATPLEQLSISCNLLNDVVRFTTCTDGKELNCHFVGYFVYCFLSLCSEGCCSCCVAEGIMFVSLDCSCLSLHHLHSVCLCFLCCQSCFYPHCWLSHHFYHCNFLQFLWNSLNCAGVCHFQLLHEQWFAFVCVCVCLINVMTCRQQTHNTTTW